MCKSKGARRGGRAWEDNMSTTDIIDNTSHIPGELVPVMQALARVGRDLCRTIKRGPLGGNALGAGVGENLGGDQQKALDVMADEAFEADLKTTSVRYYASEEQDEVIELNLDGKFALAIDRLNPQVAHLYQPLDPAVIRLVKQVTDVAKDKGIEVFMCGEMAAAAHHIPLLLGLGLDELSMNPQSIPEIKRVIRTLNIRDAQDFVQQALKKKTARGVFGLVKEAFGDILDNRY